MVALLSFLEASLALILPLSCLIDLVNSQGSAGSDSATSVVDIFQFPDVGSWIENIAIRANGQLLITRLDVPELWNIDPTDGSATLVNSFVGASGATGITEISHDVFAVVTGTIDLIDHTSTPDSWKIWIVDMNKSPPTFRSGPYMKGSVLLNGATTFHKRENTILVADSTRGVIFKVNTMTFQYWIALKDPSMLPVPGAPIGVNGVHMLHDFVYYTSSTKGLLCRVPVDGEAMAAGPAECVTQTRGFKDDFALRGDGTTFVATNPLNTVIEIQTPGYTSVVAGDFHSSQVAGATSCRFGRRLLDLDVLYVTTNGGLLSPVNGSFVEPGKVVAIRLPTSQYPLIGLY